jgi:hypothetical protein
METAALAVGGVAYLMVGGAVTALVEASGKIRWLSDGEALAASLLWPVVLAFFLALGILKGARACIVVGYGRRRWWSRRRRHRPSLPALHVTWEEVGSVDDDLEPRHYT